MGRDLPTSLLDQNVLILSELQETLGGPVNESIQAFVEILRSKFAHYNWVGVYLVKGDNLVLKAYAGDQATQHVTIPIGQGICGAAARAGKTVIVDDVNQDPRYLACFPSTRSEIVVPIINGKKTLGEIDVDSDKLEAFTWRDKRVLEEAAGLLGQFLNKKMTH